MIPKKIHYCWYGNNKKSPLVRKCIESWKRNFPDYDIIEWNESNTDIHVNGYVEEAYKNKKWAFVSDYIRMLVLYKYGGVYFDTDVEVLKPFPSEMMESDSFAGIESFTKEVSPGLVFACHKNNNIVKRVLETYEGEKFENALMGRTKTINVRITELLSKDGYVKEDRYQEIEGMRIFPSEIFCAYDGERRIQNPTENTLSIHHYAASWLPWYKKVKLRFGTMLRRLGYRKKR